MSKTLITFLGRKPAHGYDHVTYDFDGTRKTTSFFGLALAEIVKPDRLVILGTRGSMWDVLVESLAQAGEWEDERFILMGNAEHQNVTQSQLDALSPALSDRLGMVCQLKIIPGGADEAEQVEILRIMAQGIEHNDSAILDITHGFRHLPMLVLLSAMYLESARNARIEHIYYGAFDMKNGDGNVPAVRLNGLMRVGRWIKALSTYDKDGDYGVFSELFGQEGIANADLLQRASFHERCSNPVKARQSLTSFKLDGVAAAPVASLFRQELTNRLRWFRGAGRAEWEIGLARTYLEKRDYLRATIYALEAYITRSVESASGNIQDFNTRDSARKRMAEASHDFKIFTYLRNSLAHGVRPHNEECMKLLGDEDLLYSKVQEFVGEFR